MLILLYIILLYLLLFIIIPYQTLQVTARTVGYIIFRKKSIGYDIPKTGGALLIANHVSHLDFILVSIATKRKVYFVMYDKMYYKKSIHWILKRLSMIPISPSRNGEKSNLEEFNKKCQDIINNGDIVVIYPEGTVSRNGHLLEFKKGMEHIASGINAPIIPMHVYGASGSPFTFSIQEGTFNKLKLKNLRKKIIINIGKPLSNNTSAFLARQKVLELIAENAFYSHSNRYINFTNNIYKQSNSSPVFYDGNEKITVGQLIHSFLSLQDDLATKTKANQEVILSFNNELNLIITTLALTQLGKRIILLDPKSSTNEKELFFSNFKSTPIIADYSLELTENSILFDSIKSNSNIAIKIKANIPFFVRNLFKVDKTKSKNTTVLIPNFKGNEISLDEITLTNMSAFSESISNTHNISNYGTTFNLKETYSPIGFLTKIVLPITTELSTLLNITNNEKALSLSNSLIGEQLQIETLYLNTSKEIWKGIHNLITDLELAEEVIIFSKENNIKIYKATGIDGIVGLLSINTPDYEGKDIAGKQLLQDGNNPNTFGRPVQGIAVKIVSKEDKDVILEANKEGRILVKGPLVMLPAHHSPFEWIDVNLTGYLTPEGYLQILEI